MKLESNHTSEKIHNLINQADDLMVNDILQAAIHRHAEIYPDWEAVIFFLPKNNPGERRQQIEQTFEFIKKHYP